MKKHELGACPRDQNQGRGPDCPDHPRRSGLFADGRLEDWCVIAAVVLAYIVLLMVVPMGPQS